MGVGLGDRADLWTWTPTLMVIGAVLGWEEGEESSRWLRLWGWGGVGCTVFPVFDVNTGHLAQVKAAVYVFLSDLQGRVSCYILWGERIFCLSNHSPPCHIPHPHLPSSSLQGPLVSQEIRPKGHCP